jgi:hypothetical protein
MMAWLITWQGSGALAEAQKPIVAIMNSRISGDRMLKIIEQIYVNERYSLSERIAYVKNRKNNPYPAYFGTFKNAHCSWEVYCGPNPYLYARVVGDLKVELNSDGEEELTWKEPREFGTVYQPSDGAT